MANFVRDTNTLLDSQNNGDAMNCPFVIILSDGRFNKNNVRPFLNEAKEKKYLYIFVILDKTKEPVIVNQTAKNKNQNQRGDGSILSMKSVEKNQDGSIKLVPYLKDFPFDYYCIIRDIQQLPSAIGNILIQWFSLISGGSSAN
jgi:midasin